MKEELIYYINSVAKLRLSYREYTGAVERNDYHNLSRLRLQCKDAEKEVDNKTAHLMKKYSHGEQAEIF